MLNQNKTVFPSLANMSVEEVCVMAKVCCNAGDSPQKTSEIINCVDDCLSILKSTAIINRICRERKWYQQSVRDIIAQ